MCVKEDEMCMPWFNYMHTCTCTSMTCRCQCPTLTSVRCQHHGGGPGLWEVVELGWVGLVGVVFHSCICTPCR